MSAVSKTLAGALVAAQKAMPAVEPNAKNPHFNSMFVSLDHLIAKTRGVLNEHGLAITQFPSTGEHGPVLRTIIVHADSGETLEADTPLLLGKQDMQQLGAAITYARRYAWASALGISSDEDDDGNSVSKDSGATPTATKVSEKEKTRGNDEAEALALKLVAEKLGDVALFTTAMDNARREMTPEKYAAWLSFQIAHWERQKKAFIAPTSVTVPGKAA